MMALLRDAITMTPLSRTDMADYLASNPDTFSQVMSRLKASAESWIFPPALTLQYHFDGDDPRMMLI